MFQPRSGWEALASPDTCMTALTVAAIGLWGPGFVHWSPLATAMEAAPALAGMSEQDATRQLDKLFAGAAVLASDRFFQLAPDFLAIAHAINGDGYDPSTWSASSAADAAWALFEARALEALVFGHAHAAPLGTDVDALLRESFAHDGAPGGAFSPGPAGPPDDGPNDEDARAARDGAVSKREDVDREIAARWGRLKAQVARVLGEPPRTVAALVVSDEPGRAAL